MPRNLIHNRDLIRSLHEAHADYIEETYRGLATIPGNPRQIEIKQIEGVRIFRSEQASFINRAIFTGLETQETIQAVLTYIKQAGVDFFLEVNPANFHPDLPSSWRSPLLKMLLAAGFWPGAFRCVWYYDGFDGFDRPEPEPDNFRIEMMETKALASKIEYVFEAEEIPPKDRAEHKMDLLHGEQSEHWRHYLGYENDTPCAKATLLLKGQSAYLAWGYTHSRYRQRGYHRAMTRRRVRDAQANGCNLIFSVSDLTNPSAITLQTCGFRLAYNYLMMNSPAKGNS